MTQISKEPRCCDEIARLLPPTFFKALCDPGRVGMLCRLAACGTPCTVSQIAECCPIDVSVVSRHLAMLRDAGILRAEKRGKEVYYSVNGQMVVGTLRAIADAIEDCCAPEKPRSRTSRSMRRRR